MAENNNEFAPGIFYKAPHQNAPDFVKGKINIKIQEAINFLQNELRAGNQWANLDMKKSREGKIYLTVDRWQPNNGQQQQQTPQSQGFQQAPPQTGNNQPLPQDTNYEDPFDFTQSNDPM